LVWNQSSGLSVSHVGQRLTLVEGVGVAVDAVEDMLNVKIPIVE